jgi:prepilin-type N-terminal cleavage/methylation domain-containing protein
MNTKKFYSKKIDKRFARGFTLVELLVAMAVFMVVITISLGSIVSILDAGRKARSLKSVMTNLNFTFEVLSRDLKFGNNYYCGVTTQSSWTPQNCTGSFVPPASGITFITSDGIPTIYRLNGTQLEKSTDYGVTYTGITSPDIIIQDLKFFVFGAGTGDNAQPRVLILIRGYAGTKPTAQSSFVLQTTVSQRGIE